MTRQTMIKVSAKEREGILVRPHLENGRGKKIRELIGRRSEQGRRMERKVRAGIISGNRTGSGVNGLRRKVLERKKPLRDWGIILQV